LYQISFSLDFDSIILAWRYNEARKEITRNVHLKAIKYIVMKFISFDTKKVKDLHTMT